MKTSSDSSAVEGIGYRPAATSSSTVRPGNASNSSRASSGLTGRSVSTVIVSLWQLLTGMRTQVALMAMSGASRILRVSRTILSSSDV